MIQGTGSNVGKSLLVSGLARAFLRRGLKVMPFKPQNLSNNAAVTADGGEIGRSQALQALAARVPASVHMNPILLKSEEGGSLQVIVQGRRLAASSLEARADMKRNILPRVLESFAHVEAQADLVLVEGAGSPAETNLRRGDLANMGFAQAANVPVILAGDVDRGGVIAAIVGTHCVLEPEDRDRIKGFLINRFRGDVELFGEGLSDIVRRTGWPSLGIVPWFDRAADLPAEDILDLMPVAKVGKPSGAIRIVVPVLEGVSNFDDFDPLRLEPDVDLRLIHSGEALPGDAELVVLTGSKSTVADLGQFRDQGWDIDLQAHYRRGGAILGLCGGYQMLGRAVHDPTGVEGAPGDVAGLGLLDVETVIEEDKRLAVVTGRHVETGSPVRGYEIHLGRTDGADCARPFLQIEGQPAGASSPDGQVAGCYLHGLFSSDPFREAFLGSLRKGVSQSRGDRLSHDARVEGALDVLADHVEAALDLDAILSIARTRQ
ncbi:cobyric acid synthase [Breoghania sp.]|uniref:cobyric acid synthase n=1 Tax=Breoghania sp. TaxID=2065378 RepID=UPI002AAAD068|nr:cobyric acid synthase [Breoghania sp.]